MEEKKKRIRENIRYAFLHIPKARHNSNWPHHVKSTLDYIHTHCLDNNFTIYQLRRKIYGGESNNLSCDFSFFIGKSPKSYSLYIRIEISKLLLAENCFRDVPIYLIARELGFSGNGAFNHAFTESEGMSPGKWRRKIFNK